MVKLLCTSDLHMGRLPTSLPPNIDGLSVSPSSVWGEVVDVALRERVDVVLLGGDLIDRSNRFFEAFGPLESGIRKLIDEGITVVAVAGNHDFDALPRFARSFHDGQYILNEQNDADDAAEGRVVNGGFHLIGLQGKWERLTVVNDDRAIVVIDGWSFPDQHVSWNPLTESDVHIQPIRSEDIPHVGLLHADLGQRQSQYAPVHERDLIATGHDVWCLGHIHKPFFQGNTAEATIVYPGSLQPLDPGETGVHGPWLITIHPTDESSARLKYPFNVETKQIPLARLAYDNVTVDVTGAERVSDVQSELAASVRRHLAEACERGGSSLRHVLLRLVISGRTKVHRQLDETFIEEAKSLQPTVGDARAHIVRIAVETVPDRDLQTIATGKGAPALLARLLEDPPEKLKQRMHRIVSHVRRDRAYTHLEHTSSSLNETSNSPDEWDAKVTRWMKDEGLRILDALLVQKEDEGETDDRHTSNGEEERR